MRVPQAVRVGNIDRYQKGALRALFVLERDDSIRLCRRPYSCNLPRGVIRDHPEARVVPKGAPKSVPSYRITVMKLPPLRNLLAYLHQAAHGSKRMSANVRWAPSTR